MSTIHAGLVGGLVAGLFMTIATPSHGQIVPNGVVPLRPGVGYSVSVLPDGTPATYPANSGPHSLGFTLVNNGIYTDTYTLTCSSVGGIACGSVVPSSLQLAPDWDESVTVTFSVGSTGGTLRLTASGIASDQGYYSITAVTPPPPAVAPDGDTVLVFRSTTGLQQQFLVKNVDSTSHSYSLTKSCTGAAVSTCSLDTTSMTLAAGESRPATITYQTNTSTSGIVKVIATQIDQSLAKDSGWVPLRTVASPAPVVSLAANPGTDVERGSCLTIAAGSSAAIECGDLRIVHPLPAIRTLNKRRQPVLVYNSATAAPRIVVVGHVTLTGGSGIDSVEAILRVNGIQRASGRWAGANWASSGTSTRQIGLSYSALTNDTTGIYPYTLEVATLPSGGGRYATTLSGKLIMVNRSTSEFGAGWWLAGFERLRMAPNNSRLWVGGDGSAREYRSAGTNVWVGPSAARPDTIRWNGSYYVRVLASGDTVKFDGSGWHEQTVNRLGYHTTFSAVSGRLCTISLPSQGGSQTYQLTYASACYSGNLTAVTAPPNGSQSRVTSITQSSGKITQIQDPGQPAISFGYSGNLITTRTDRRGTLTRYDYAGLRFVWRVMVQLSTTDSIQTGFIDWQRRGLVTDTTLKAATDTANAYSSFYGARHFAAVPDSIAQETRFWVDRHGAPRKIENALSQTTTLTRADAQFTALVTRVQYPNGRILGAGYDRRGNIVFSADSTNESGVATTRYVWDAKWNVATRVVPPLGDSVVMGYDPTTGNRLWQQDARGSASRTTFTYWGSGNKQGLLWQVNPPLTPNGNYVFDYDTARANLKSVTAPTGAWTHYLQDAIGRDTATSVPIGAGSDSTRTRTVYSIMDLPVTTITYTPAVDYTSPRYLQQTVDAQELWVENSYDDEGNLVASFRSGESATLITSNTYDRANRRTAVRNSGADSTEYDPAGNPVRVITARGDTITMRYDAMNRLVRRDVPAVDYAYAGCAEHDLSPSCGFRFPLYPNLPDSGLRIAARVDTFAYDAMGNMTYAANEFARVQRTYNKDGSIASDVQSLRDYGGSAFSTHVYALSYDYDLNGRRTGLTHPAGVAPDGAMEQQYAYYAFGALASVRNVSGNVYTYLYDAAGRLDSLDSPGGGERYRYDDDGRLVERWDRVGGSLLQHDIIGHTVQGQIASVSQSGGSIGWNATNVYDGFGNVVLYQAQSMISAETIAEEYRQDGVTNATWRRKLGTNVYLDPVHTYQYDGHGRVTQIVQEWPWEVPDPPSDWTPDTTYNVYDGAGNVRYAGWRHANAIDPYPTMNRRATASFFAADGKLTVQQLYLDSINYYGVPQKKRGVYEEYWYDALGRRVLARRRADSLCTGGATVCASTIERFVWDGDQILYELRGPGADGLSTAALNDTPPYATTGHEQFGWVAYTHGPGIDAPLDLIRMGYGQWGDEEITVIPHTNWRGEYGAGTDTVGVQLVNIDFQWPADFRGAFHGDDGAWGRGLPEWFGSLIQGKRDMSGLMYMRNRYYDPNTGRFTQEDPIGLAGGLNLYGFAQGDPVNFGDPFGLCPIYLTGRPCLNPVLGSGGPPELRPDGLGGFNASRGGGIRIHRGNDLSAPLGSAIGAADQGMVISLERDEERGGKAGQYVIIGHFDDDGQLVSFTTYMHLSEIGGDLQAGSLVSAGQQIGLSGETGNAAGTPPHLHFEIRTKRRGGWVDPARELGINEEKP